MCVPGGARGLGASVGKPQWHPICRHILAQRGHTNRAVHPCTNLGGHHWSAQEATGDTFKMKKSQNNKLAYKTVRK